MADKKYRLKFQMSDGSERPVEFTAPQGDPGVVDVDSATVGQIIKVKAVDASGKPTEWEAVDPLALDANLSDSTKAAPANAVGAVQAKAYMAMHGAITAGEGALINPYADAYTKIVTGEVVNEVYVHVSDRVPTMSDIEAGYSFMFGFPIADGNTFCGIDGECIEVPSKVFEEEIFSTTTSEVDGVIILFEGLGIIVPSDNFTLDGVFLPKKGIYLYYFASAFRINGYSFSGAELPFGEVTKYGDTVTWDGDISGRVYAQPTSEDAVYVVKVSDAVPTAEDCAEGVTAVHSEGVTVSEIVFNDDGFGMVNEIVLIVPWGNYQYGDVTFPQSGVYFLKTTGEYEGYVTSFTIPGYTGFATGTEINTIDPKYLPEDLQFVSTWADSGGFKVEGSTVTWDGVSGEKNGSMFLVTEDVDWFLAACQGATSITALGHGLTTPATITIKKDDAFLPGAWLSNGEDPDATIPDAYDFVIFVAEEDGVDISLLGGPSSVKKGVYQCTRSDGPADDGYYYIETLTFNDYDLESKMAGDRMEEKYLPESVESVVIRSSTEGSTKKFKVTVDDSGSITATEVTE